MVICKSKCLTQTVLCGATQLLSRLKPMAGTGLGMENHRRVRAPSAHAATFTSYGTMPGLGVKAAMFVNTPAAARVAGKGVPEKFVW